MKTRMGRFLLSKNSKMIDELSKNYRNLVKELKRLKPKDPNSEARLYEIFKEAKTNREKRDFLQSQINIICEMESYITYKPKP
jgi:hypothetical protein